MMNIEVNSETGTLEGVILHTLGNEIENMNPKNAERALYSDILNLTVASKEYEQFSGILNKFTDTFQVRDLLFDVIQNPKIKENLLEKICQNEQVKGIINDLMNLPNEELVRQLIEGVILKKNTLTDFMRKNRYALRPLHNFFFTRDSAVSINNNIFISRMASNVRAREAIIMETIFDYSPYFRTKTINPVHQSNFNSDISIEGGDVIVAREDILLIGLSSRTSSQGVDFVLEQFKKTGIKKHIIVQELPETPESFIHLDMTFTFLDIDKCMVYEPLITRPNRYQTVHIEIDGKKVNIKHVKSIPDVLKKLGMDLKTIPCGGNRDIWIQEREQWHSGANFFALAPGKVTGYGRNIYTIEELNKNGFEVLKAADILKGKTNMDDYERFVVTIAGSELSRGGGGARCMTMPVKRKKIN